MIERKFFYTSYIVSFLFFIFSIFLHPLTFTVLFCIKIVCHTNPFSKPSKQIYFFRKPNRKRAVLLICKMIFCCHFAKEYCFFCSLYFFIHIHDYFFQRHFNPAVCHILLHDRQTTQKFFQIPFLPPPIHM